VQTEHKKTNVYGHDASRGRPEADDRLLRTLEHDGVLKEARQRLVERLYLLLEHGDATERIVELLQPVVDEWSLTVVDLVQLILHRRELLVRLRTTAVSFTVGLFCSLAFLDQSRKKRRLEMWANAQRDGRPAEYRWPPLFNAAVWLCSNAAKTRNPLKFARVPQTNETISAASGPKFTIL